MAKPKTIPVIQPHSDNKNNRTDNLQEPLSGSKNTKNQQHSRQKHGEGS